MNPDDSDNPYQAPEAVIAALQAEIRRPSVYTAISLLSWTIGAVSLLASILMFFPELWGGPLMGWRRAPFSNDGPRVILLTGLGLMATISYLAAGRLLWVRRGPLGLSLCTVAMFMTYLAAWILTWRR